MKLFVNFCNLVLTFSIVLSEQNTDILNQLIIEIACTFFTLCGIINIIKTFSERS